MNRFRSLQCDLTVGSGANNSDCDVLVVRVQGKGAKRLDQVTLGGPRYLPRFARCGPLTIQTCAIPQGKQVHV